jgi:hypothetical protein
VVLQTQKIWNEYDGIYFLSNSNSILLNAQISRILGCNPSKQLGCLGWDLNSSWTNQRCWIVATRHGEFQCFIYSGRCSCLRRDFSFSRRTQYPILISKHVATRSHPLTDQQVEENKIIEDARRKSFSHPMISPFQSSNGFFVRCDRTILQ